MRFRQPGSAQQDLFGQLDHARKMADRVTPLDKLAAAVDFEMFRDLLVEALGYNDRVDKGGNAPFDPVFMFKIAVLQKYYALSEEQTEEQILDRFSFMRFLGVAPGDAIPDKNTIWDFKERLGADGVAALFAGLDAALAERGIHGKEGVTVDASFVEVPRQRNGREENAAIKRGETPEGWDQKPRMLCQKDLDARWAKKNNEVHYGYKNHAKADVKTKLVRDYRVSAASEHDSQCFGDLVGEGDGTVYADSAYRSRGSMAMLRGMKVKARICQKGSKGKPLSAAQKRENRKKSRVRARAEHVFGTQAWQMKADRIATIGIVRATRGIGLGNLVYNLVRLAQLNLRVGWA
jgi:IS5 family transposase